MNTIIKSLLRRHTARTLKVNAIIVGILIVLALIDRLTKIAAVEYLSVDSITIIPKLLEVTYQPNPNLLYVLSFSLWGTLAIIGIVLLFVLVVAVRICSMGNLIAGVGYGMIIIGAFSNIYDRLMYESVIDMIRIPNITVFNLADVMIILGAVGVLIGVNRVIKKQRSDKKVAAR